MGVLQQNPMDCGRDVLVVSVRCEVAAQDAVARAVFSARVHHSRSSIIVLAGVSSSASPAPTSPPWKCAHRVATGMWTDERTGAS